MTQTSELHVTLSGEKGEVRVPFVTFLRPEMLLQILQAAGTNAQVLVFTGELDE